MLNRIVVNEKLDNKLKETFMKLQKEHREKVEGISELYDGLYINGRCESYSRDRIYYVAYTLATKRIDFTVEA